MNVKHRLYRFVHLASATAILAGCAAHADKIQPAYVSPLQYSDYSCKQIRMEMTRISRRVNEVAGVQDKQASNDSALYADVYDASVPRWPDGAVVAIDRNGPTVYVWSR